jgi:UDP-N-acetylglucosamine--dolichyl-phosphate N-acetylglucosaminephosphotransferase
MSDAAVKPRPLPSILLISVLPIASWFIVRPLITPVPPLPALYVSVGISLLSFLSTIHLVPALGSAFVKANLKGRDLLKIYSTPMCALNGFDWIRFNLFFR